MNKNDEIDKIAHEIKNKLSTEDIKYIRDEVTNMGDMIQYHHGFGTSVRNEYNFWSSHPLTEQWRKDVDNDVKTYIIDDVDTHPDHPDAISMDILYRLWEIVHYKI